MKYNFDKLTNRFNTNSIKWNVNETELPMWIADMDFEVAPEIVSKIQQRIDNKIFGYTELSENWYTSIINWWDQRHGVKFKKEQMMFCTGVIPAISSIVRKMTNIGDNVLVQAPVYNIFYNSIVNNERKVLSNDLIYNGKKYEIDFLDLEKKLSNPKTTLMILCNPANPVGRVWNKNELTKIAKLAKENNVLVLSDEIHCDLVWGKNKYIPFSTIDSTNSITCISATKTFNIAGLQTAIIVAPNNDIKIKVERGINTDEVAEPNVFAAIATEAAFSEAGNWKDQLVEYLEKNKKYILNFFKKELSEISVVDLEATYLLWVDVTNITKDSKKLCEFIRDKTGLFVNGGDVYGGNGSGFIRLNFATQYSRVVDGLEKLKTGIDEYKRFKNI